MRVLFITSNRLGDAVLSTGVLDWIVARYPGVKITVACGPYASGLFRAVPGLERLIIFRKKAFNLHWVRLWANCIGTQWDMIVDMRNSLAARLLYTKKLVHPAKSTGDHKVIENAKALKLIPPPTPHIWLDAQAKHDASLLLPKTQPYIAFGPAANWPPKQWPVENFIALAQELTSETGLFPKAAVLVIAGETERASSAALLEALPANQVFPIIGQDLLTVSACLKSCALFVGNDSGLMHMAAAMGVSTLGLFGPSKEKIYGPWGSHCATVRTPESQEELLRRLSFPGAFAPNLMQNLSIEAVKNAVHELLTSQIDS